MTTFSPQMAMTIDCDKLLSVPSGYLTPLPPAVNLQYGAGKATDEHSEDDTQSTPKQDPGQFANLVTATDLHEKLSYLAQKQWVEEASGETQKPFGDDFVKVPLPVMLPPPAPHMVPREPRKPRVGSIVSKGSVGHPLNCASACKYVKRKGGCRDGADCPNCHECFWSKATAKETAPERKAEVFSTRQEELVEKVIRLLNEEHQVPPMPTGWSAYQAPLGDVGGSPEYIGVKLPSASVQAGLLAEAPVPCNPGSLGHPFNCGPACKYVLKPRGCKDGDLCSHCHICRWTRFAAKNKFSI